MNNPTKSSHKQTEQKELAELGFIIHPDYRDTLLQRALDDHPEEEVEEAEENFFDDDEVDPYDPDIP